MRRSCWRQRKSFSSLLDGHRKTSIDLIAARRSASLLILSYQSKTAFFGDSEIMPPTVDASNAALPAVHPVIVSVPPVPKCERGERVSVDGKAGRLNKDKSVLCYPSGKNIIVRNIEGKPLLPDTTSNKLVDSLVYRGHAYQTSAAKISTSGGYVASGDSRGKLRIWAYDHEDHLTKYECQALTGPVRDIDWDFESKRVVVCGERDGAGSAACAIAIQWDTGVTVGQLASHLKGRAASCAFKPSRPFKLVTAGKDDHKTYFHKGPPFNKVPPADNVPEENGHSKGAVNAVRYNYAGTMAVSVGTDRSICTYEGKEFKLLKKLEAVHTATIYDVAFSEDDKTVMTASGDGSCKLFSVADDGTLTESGVWKPAEFQLGKTFDRVPVGGNQVGCAFVNGTPISVGLNGQISVLPKKPSGTSSIKVITGHYAAVDAMAVDPSGSFYTGDTDGIMCAWDLKTAQPKGRLDPPEGNGDLMFVTHGGAISGMAFAPKSKLMYSVGWDDKCFITQSGKVQMNPLGLAGQPSAIAAGGEVAVVCTVNGLQVINGKSLGELISVPYLPQTVCVSKNDKTVYVGGDDCKVHVYTVSGLSLKESSTLEGHLKPVFGMKLSNDESKLASSDTRDVIVWDLKESKAIVGKGRWCFHAQRITCLAWASDDSFVASGGADDSIYLWCLAKKSKRVHYEFAHRGGITGLTFIPTSDGSHKLVSVGTDSVVNQWDVTADAKAKFE